ncbi:MAG: hypothetical protein L4877_03205 [Aigarchaeota archaeon]|nr:hypothetical protein [Candidatus Geocrenenecus dongiae]
MSGLGGVAVFAVLTITTITVIGYTATYFSMQISMIESKVNEVLEENLDKLSRIELIRMNISQNNATTSIYVSIVNKCCKPIPVKDLAKLDVILVYRNGEETKCIWLPYDKSKISPEGWRPLNITYSNGRELVNPSNVDLSTGLWDVGEELNIEAWVNLEIHGPLVIILHPPYMRGG